LNLVAASAVGEGDMQGLTCDACRREATEKATLNWRLFHRMLSEARADDWDQFLSVSQKCHQEFRRQSLR